ncbi:hypothetical protein QBC39DRAFT_105496 [Podospora conica]|nr:hypothetical protein QBC39DRAFT_105496 [Schizothecium conicum]
MADADVSRLPFLDHAGCQVGRVRVGRKSRWVWTTRSGCRHWAGHSVDTGRRSASIPVEPVSSSGVAGDKGAEMDPGGDRPGQRHPSMGEPAPPPKSGLLSCRGFDEAVDTPLLCQHSPGAGGPRCWPANGHLLFRQSRKDRNGKTAQSRGAERKGGRHSDLVGRIGRQVPACCIPFLVWSHCHTHTRPSRHGREKGGRRETDRPATGRPGSIFSATTFFPSSSRCGIVARRLDVERRLEIDAGVAASPVECACGSPCCLPCLPQTCPQVPQLPQISAKEARARCSR